MSTTEPRTPRAYEAMEALAGVEVLDPPADAISGWVRRAIPHGPIKDALSGSWLGHSLHPLLTDLPIGLWVSALALDWLGPQEAEPASERLIALGLGAAVPTVLTGATEWADSTVGSTAVKRVGLIHAASNALATGLFTGSWVARRQGARSLGRALALAAGGALGVGGYLGGHLSYAEGIGVDRTAFEEPQERWHDALDAGQLVEGRPQVVQVEGIHVLLVRQGDEVFALSNRCAHRGGPLNEGKVEDGCVRCPLHGSLFRLSDGALREGPSAYPQPTWETRVEAGRIRVRPATE
jgi:nitrite reductase/ring-hydroxylating ferredoxin subunit/uncharacterized membrane protein